MKRFFAFALFAFSLARVAPAFAAEPAPPAREAWVMHFDSDWKIAGALPEKVMLIGLQGLANRSAPRLYIVHLPSLGKDAALLTKKTLKTGQHVSVRIVSDDGDDYTDVALV